MAIKLQDIAKEFGMKVSEVRDYIDLLELKVPKNALEVKEDIAEILRSEIKKDAGEADVMEESDDRQEDVAEVYDEIVAEKQEREIRKAQKKKRAGKIRVDKKDEHEELGASSVQSNAEGIVEIGKTISVKEFAEKTGIPVARVIGELMKNGILATINQIIDYETAAIVATDFKVKIAQRHETATTEQLLAGDLNDLLREDDPKALVERPPVVVIMGHVDHGKTKLLDAIRETDVVSQESGGITQHIGAYQVTYKGKKITFLDTPGHEAFTEMRARGAKVTDIAILVVSAEESVKPQTVEAYNHAKAAGVPIIVAINKIDKPGADIDRTKREVAEMGLQPEDWGGDTIMVPLSALTKQGIDKLLESILLIAELKNLRANPHRPAIGTVIESNLDSSLGPIATVVINTGSLKVGDSVVVGGAYGKIKRMMDAKGIAAKRVGPSGAVRIAGLSEVPQTGDVLLVVENEKIARDKALEMGIIVREKRLASSSMREILKRIQSGELRVLKIILKADTQGSLEGIMNALNKIETSEVKVQVIHSGVGHISASDINMAAASMAVVMGFHVTISPQVKRTAEQMGVEARTYTIIYQIVDEVKAILEGLLDPEVTELDLGEAEILKIFLTKKNEMIVGCRVRRGKLMNNVQVRVIRSEIEVGTGIINSLKRGSEAVKEVAEGYECGVRFQGNIHLEEGDKIQAYRKESKKRTL